MFVGHFALAFAAKRAAPRASLGALVAATCLLDLAWPVLVLLGVEQVRIAPGITAFTPLDFVRYPWTHSLAMALAWGAAFGLAYRWRTGAARAAWVVGALVVSHWLLDWISHRPDLQLAPGVPLRTGLGLWRSVPATLAVEGALFAGGVAVYLATTRARNRRGAVALWALVAVLLAAWAGDVGQPPPSVAAVAWVGLAAGAVFVPWAWWIDRNREVRAEAAAAPEASPG